MAKLPKTHRTNPNAEKDVIHKFDELFLGPQIQARFAQDTTIRLVLVIWICFLTSGWTILVGYALHAALFGSATALSNNVLIAMLSTTTLNILPLSALMLRGYFIQQPPNSQ